MASELSFHAVYKSINRPLTIWGADRRLFLLALMLGAAVFNFFGSLVGGLVLFPASAAARWLTATTCTRCGCCSTPGPCRRAHPDARPGDHQEATPCRA
jgi:hypothetical protein